MKTIAYLEKLEAALEMYKAGLRKRHSKETPDHQCKMRIAHEACRDAGIPIKEGTEENLFADTIVFAHENPKKPEKVSAKIRETMKKFLAIPEKLAVVQ